VQNWSLYAKVLSALGYLSWCNTEDLRPNTINQEVGFTNWGATVFYSLVHWSNRLLLERKNKKKQKNNIIFN
jgi:hypothetical protein